MKYKSFRIQNFKGIKDLTLDFSGDPKTQIYTLVGLNENGKTTILEAIEKDQPREERYKLIPKSQSANFTNSISVAATLYLDDSDCEELKQILKKDGFYASQIPNTVIIIKNYTFEDSEFKESKTSWAYRIKGTKVRSKKEFEIYVTHPDFKSVEEWIKISRPPILYYENFLFEFPKKIYLEDKESHTPQQKRKNQIYRDILQDVLDSFNGNLSLEKHVLERLKTETNSNSDKAALKATIKKMGAKISNVVLGAWQDLFDAQGKEIVVEHEYDGENGYYLALTLSEGSETYEIADRSLGFKWFFTFLLFTEFRKNRAKDKGEILFLLDEPASNLHSTAQQKLLKRFENLVNSDAGVTRCKLVYTTHSHHLINPKLLLGTYIVRNKALKIEQEFEYDTSQTDIEACLYRQFVAKNPDQKDYFKPILDALEYQPGLLEKIPSIIITEGKNDFYTFLYLKEVIFPNQFERLNFYPGSGAQGSDIILRLYTAWGKDCKLLLDGDKEGISAKKRYIDEIGPIIEGQIFTLSDVEPEWKSKSTENIFSAQDQVEITKRFKPAAKGYEKSAFNTALLNLWSDKERIELTSETVSNFKKLFEFLDTPVPSFQLAEA